MKTIFPFSPGTVANADCSGCGWFDTTAAGNMTKVFNEKIDTDSIPTNNIERYDTNFLMVVCESSYNSYTIVTLVPDRTNIQAS